MRWLRPKADDSVQVDWRRLASHPDFQRLWESSVYTSRVKALEDEREKTKDPARFQAIQAALAELRWIKEVAFEHANLESRKPAPDADVLDHPLSRRGGA